METNPKAYLSGQILTEVIIAVAVVGTIAAVIASIFFVGLRATESGEKRSQAVPLALEALEATRIIAMTDYDAGATVISGWIKLFCPAAPIGESCSNGASSADAKGAGGTSPPAYKTLVVSNRWDLAAGSESITLGNETYTRYVYIQNVCRDASGNIIGVTDADASGWPGETENCTPSTNNVDRSTLRIRVEIKTQGMRDVVVEDYLTRWPSKADVQTDWSGGATCQAPSCTVTTFTTTYDVVTPSAYVTTTTGGLILGQ